jgi:hypothetical protein
MKTTLLCSVALISSLQFAHCQESTPNPKPPGRHETTVTLDFGADGKKTMTFPASLYVTPEGWITLLAGERHTIEFDIVDGQPKNLRYVADKSKKGKPGTGRLTVSLKQDKDITMLMREADSPTPLAMRCLTQSYGEDNLRQTNLNPVGKLPYGDSWANTVCSVMLGELRFAEEPKKDAKPKPK